MKTTQPTVKIGVALLLAACGLALMVHLHPEELKAPAWVAYVALGLFGFAGICIAAQALRLNGLARWLVCVLLGAMVVIPVWIAFGSGARQCTAISVGARSAVSEVTCRGAFGVGAAIIVVMFIFAVRGAIRSRHAG